MDFNLSEIYETIFRSIISLVTLFLVTKMIGKKQVSQLSLFDYVIGISIGNFAAEMSINLETNEFTGTLAVVIFGLVAYLVSWLSMKSIFLRRFFFGSPSVIIQDGKILDNEMRKCRIDLNDLLEQARIAGYFDISQIAFAVMEVNGSMSFLPKGIYEKPTVGDMNISVKKQGMLANVILDGKIMTHNLENINKNENWLRKEIKKQGYKDIEEILLATVDVNNEVTVFKKNSDIKTRNIFE